MRKEIAMTEKIKKVLDALTSYKALAILWLLLGISVLVIGNISRLNYFCVWAVLMMEMAFHVIDENKKDKSGNDR